MKYINNSDELKVEFDRLMKDFDSYYWMIAWAGKIFPYSEKLLNNSHKIKQLVVGLHFYQTDPSFIEAFNPIPSVNFIKKTSGIFHPKVYLFVNNEKDWEALIGSANLTSSAFNKNNEACMLIKAADVDIGFLQDIKDSINAVWKEATKFSQAELEDYKILANQAYQPDEFNGAEINPNPQQEAPIVQMTWREYMDRILQGGSGSIMERLNLLDIVKEHFIQSPVFGNMLPLHRKQVGGYISRGQPVNFRLFGNMQNATRFTNVINTNPHGISNALDTIPRVGEITQMQYSSFVDQFEEAVDGGNKYRSGTRLLAMKRPDVFFAISEGNNQLLAEDFNITNVGRMNFSRYWHEIATVIWQSEWWRRPNPINEIERRIVPYRAAFMDVLYYQQA